jgi:uncharacterized protein YcbX
MPILRRITLFPIKSLDGCEVGEATVLASGGLRHDRRWAIVDGDGVFINGKRSPTLHRIRAAFADDVQSVELAAKGQLQAFRLPEEAQEIGRWLASVFGVECRLIENRTGGFPDDETAPGPTVVSTATLETVGSWFGGIPLEEVRRRFRANLEIDAAAPFWEDRLGAAGGAGPRFAVGPVVFRGATVCQRCPVPTRDSQTGEAWPGFARQFAERREAELPEWAPAVQFDHFYRLAINTVLESIEAGATIRVGDEVRVLSEP